MKGKLFVFLLLSTLVFAACSNTGNKQGGEESTTAELPGTPGAAGVAEAATALADISGTYTGMLPCADCEGLQTTLILNSDKSYEIDEEYEGRNVKNKTTGRPWVVSDNILTLDSLKGSRPVKYKIEENSLVQLDMNGNAITGPMADKYTLKKK